MQAFSDAQLDHPWSGYKPLRSLLDALEPEAEAAEAEAKRKEKKERKAARGRAPGHRKKK